MRQTTTDDGRRREVAAAAWTSPTAASYGGRRRRGRGGRDSPHHGAPTGGGGKRRRRRRRRGGVAEDGRRRRRVGHARRRRYGARETTGEGANERGRRGGPIYSLGLKRSDSSRKKSIRENQKLGFGDKLENEFDSDKIPNDLLRFLRGKIEENERIKTPQKSGRNGVGLRRIRRRKRGGSGSEWPAAGGRRCYRHVGPTCQALLLPLAAGRPSPSRRPSRPFSPSNPLQSGSFSSGFLRGFYPLVLLYLSPQ
jgi:hypothetical protein